jgi:hypothetical protein
MAANEKQSSQLEALLRLTQEFTTVWCNQVREHAGEKESDPVMRMYQDAMVNAWESARREVAQVYDRLDPGLRAEIDRYVAATGIITTVESAREIAASGQLASASALFNLGTIFEKIKDLIQAILKCLGIDIGCLIEILFNFIDNILRLFTGRVSQQHADYYFKIEEQAFQVRQRLLAQHARGHRHGT